MKYLIFSNKQGVPIENVEIHANGNITILVPICKVNGDCIVYDNDNGNNKIAHAIQITNIRIHQNNRMFIDAIIDNEDITIDFHHNFDSENTEHNME